MLNAENIKGMFPKRAVAVKPQPQYIPNPNYVAPAQPVAAQQQAEDPETAKLRLLMLKILSLVVGGAAILLIVWRVILKFA